MGAIISALADWLGPFLASSFAYLLSAIGPSLLLSLGLGLGVYTGLSAVQSELSSVIFSYGSLPVDMLDIARLLGVTFVLKLFISAFAARIAILSARTFFVSKS